MKNNTLKPVQHVYLVCGLDHERFEDAEFTFCANLSLVKQQCIANAKDYLHKEEKELLPNMLLDFNGTIDHNYRKIQNSRCWSYDWSNPEPKVGEPEFYLNRILELEISDGDYLCVWSHAYLGINFSISCIGTKEKCEALAKRTSMKEYNDCEDAKEYTSNDRDNGLVISFDDGLEWRVWHVLQFRKEMLQKEVCHEN